jgi:hypothetical protein
MQTAVQTSNQQLSYQTNMNAYGGGRNSPPTPASSGFNGGQNFAGQMANLMSGFSQASFSVAGQTTKNGQTSSFYAQASMSNPVQGGNSRPSQSGGFNPGFNNQPTNNRPDNHFNNQPTNSRQDNRYDSRGDSRCGGSSNNRSDNRCDSRTDTRRDDKCDNRSQGNDRTPSRDDHGCKDSGKTNQTQWTNTEVTNNKASINLGDYKLDFNKSDSSMVMTNAQTGDKTKIYGDPHLTQHATGADSNSTTAMFNGPMTFMLPDNTKVTVGTQTAANNKSVSYADQVTITRGNDAYQVTGLSQENKAGLSVQKANNGRALDAATPDGFTLNANKDGSGWINPATGKEPTKAEIAKANT